MDAVVAVAVTVLVLCIYLLAYKASERNQEQTKQVAECFCIGVDMNSSGRTYKCPDGVLYTVNSTIRNAKGE